MRQLAAMLRAEQELRAQDRGKTEAQGRELTERREEIRDLARRRLAKRLRRKTVSTSAKNAKKKIAKKPKRKALAASIGKQSKRERIHFLGVCGAQLLDHFAETIARPLPGGYSWQSEQDSPPRAETGCVAPPGNGYSPPPGSVQKCLSPFAFPALSAPLLRRIIAARIRTAGLSTASVLPLQ